MALYCSVLRWKVVLKFCPPHLHPYTRGRLLFHPLAIPAYPSGLRGGWSQPQLTLGEKRGTPWTGRLHSHLAAILELPINQLSGLNLGPYCYKVTELTSVINICQQRREIYLPSCQNIIMANKSVLEGISASQHWILMSFLFHFEKKKTVKRLWI